MCLGAADSRECEQVVDQTAHARCRLADHRQVALARRIEGRSGVLLKQLGKACHVPQRRAQVVRYGVGEGLELLVARIELHGALGKFVIELPNFVLSPFALGEVVVRFHDGGLAVLVAGQ